MSATPTTPSTPAARSDDSVTVLVFKDNYASRSFQVPLKWFSRLGLIMGGLTGIALISGFFALKYYRLASLNPAAVAEAEPQPTVTVTVTSAPIAQTAEPPAQTAPAPAPVIQQTERTAGPALLFSALPLNIRPVASSESIPIAIRNTALSWNAKKSTVRFDLQYIASDRGTQQGHILMLARGPDLLFSYPAGALNTSDKDSLLNPTRGEYFSVSRVRNTVAEFGPLPNRTAIVEIETFILSSDGKLLLHEALPVKGAPIAPPATPVSTPAPVKTSAPPPRQTSYPPGKATAAPAAPAAPEAATPHDDGSKPVEPGYDQ